MKKLVSLLLAFFVILSIGSLAFASDVSDANYYGVIRATNSGTATSNVCANVSINTTALIASGFLDETSTNAAVRVSSTDVDFMPGYNEDPWIIHYDSIGQNSNSDVTLYTGNVTGGKIVFFPDPSSDGLTIPYDPSLALGNEFEIRINNVLPDTANGTSKKIAFIDESLDLSWDETVNGTLNVSLQNQSFRPSGSDGVGTWVTGDDLMPVAYSYDNNLGTYARTWNTLGAYGNFITYTITPTVIDSISFYLTTHYPTTPTVDLDVYDIDTASWVNVFEGACSLSTWVTKTLIAPTYSSSYRLRMKDSVVNPLRLNETKVNYSVTLSIPNIAMEAIDEIIISDNTTHLSFSVNESVNTTAFTGAVYNGSNDLIFFQNGSVIYAENITVSVGGTPVSAWKWEYGDTFHDLIGDNDGTPVFRTASSDPDVSAELLNYKLVAKSTVDDDTALVWPEIMEDPPDLPETMYTDNTTPGFFFAGIVHTIAEFSEVPEALFWYNFAFTIIIIIGILVYYAAESAKSSSNGTSSKLFLKILIQGTFLCIFALPGLNIYGFFVPLYYIFFSSGVFMLAKDFGW